jgi:hypothetical protein
MRTICIFPARFTVASYLGQTNFVCSLIVAFNQKLYLHSTHCCLHNYSPNQYWNTFNTFDKFFFYCKTRSMLWQVLIAFLERGFTSVSIIKKCCSNRLYGLWYKVVLIHKIREKQNNILLKSSMSHFVYLNEVQFSHVKLLTRKDCLFLTLFVMNQTWYNHVKHMSDSLARFNWLKQMYDRVFNFKLTVEVSSYCTQATFSYAKNTRWFEPQTFGSVQQHASYWATTPPLLCPLR